MQSDVTPRRGRLRRLLSLLAVTGLALVAVLGTGQAAYAAAPAPVHSYSGLCLQPFPVDGGSIYDNGIPIWQLPCDGSLEQNWKKVQLPDGQAKQCSIWIVLLPIGRCGFDPIFKVYYLVNQKTLSCMDIRDAKTDDRTPMQQWSCNNGGSEKWWLPPSDSTVGMTYPFRNFRTDKCLDVPAATTEPSPMQEYHCTANNNAQLFDVPPA